MPLKSFLPARKTDGRARFLLLFLTILPVVTVVWSAETPRKSTRPSRLVPSRMFVVDDGMTLKLSNGAPQPSGLLLRLKMALEKESKRRLDKDPSGVFLMQADDEDGNPVKRARTEARRIFGGATGRVLNDFAELLVEDAVALRTAKNYVQGIRFDVMRGGDVRFQAGLDDSGRRIQEEPARGARGDGVAASFGLVAIGSPRLEMRATLPGSIRTQIELPLTDPGIRATFSRRLTYRMRGTLSAGVEDSGADKWATVGLGIRF